MAKSSKLGWTTTLDPRMISTTEERVDACFLRRKHSRSSAAPKPGTRAARTMRTERWGGVCAWARGVDPGRARGARVVGERGRFGRGARGGRKAIEGVGEGGWRAGMYGGGAAGAGVWPLEESSTADVKRVSQKIACPSVSRRSTQTPAREKRSLPRPQKPGLPVTVLQKRFACKDCLSARSRLQSVC